MLVTRPRGLVDGACAGSSNTSFGEELEDDLDIFVIVPHLEDRELGEPNLDDDGEVVIWDHPLPFLVRPLRIGL